MNNLYDFNLKDTLPSSIASDTKVQALAEVITAYRPYANGR